MPAQRSSTTGVHRDAVAHQILDLFPQMRRRFERDLPRELRDEMASVTVHQVEALSHLIGCGGLTMNELAQKQAIGLSSATALADRLLRQGLAQRTSDPSDRRIVRLVPTETATELVHRFIECKRRTALRALEALDDDELVTLHGLLTKMAADPGDGSEDAHGCEDAHG
jgi:DNA-binding MarR family transcriptional regulator